VKIPVSVDIVFKSEPKGFRSIRSYFKIWISKDFSIWRLWVPRILMHVGFV
jgi:hypothetical protein